MWPSSGSGNTQGFLLQAPEGLSPGLMPVNFSPAKFSPTLTSSSVLFPLLWLVDMHPHLYHHCPPHSCNIVDFVSAIVTRGWSMKLTVFKGRAPHKPQWGWEGPEQQVSSSMCLFVCFFVTIEKEIFPLQSVKNIVYFHSDFPHHILLLWGGHRHYWGISFQTELGMHLTERQ